MTRRRKILPAIRDLVRQRAGHQCEYCHTSEQWQYVPFTVDHIVPKALGGKSTWTNCVCACKICNWKKDDKPLEDTNLRLRKEPRRLYSGDLIRLRSVDFIDTIKDIWKT